MSRAEQTLAIWVDEREQKLANEHAAIGVVAGWNNVTLQQSHEVAAKIDSVLDRGTVRYASQRRRLEAMRNAFLWAWGPEATILYQVQRDKIAASVR